MLRRFKGFDPSSLGGCATPLETMSGRCSDDREGFLAFWAKPKIPSRPELPRAALAAVGDLTDPGPVVWIRAASGGDDASAVNVSLGMAEQRPLVPALEPVDDWGDSPAGEGIMSDLAYMRIGIRRGLLPGGTSRRFSGTSAESRRG